MKKVYFNPGCALSLYKPDMEHRILDFLNKNYCDTELHKICCRHNPQLEEGSVILNVCAGCDRRFRNLYEGIHTISLWEVLLQTDGFPYPDYQGVEMSVQDPCPVRERPDVHAAVRSLLLRMNIEVVEAEHFGSGSVCCGDSFYPVFTEEQVIKKMKERAGDMPCSDVAVYCVSCIKSMHIGGKTPRHLIDLLYGEKTVPGVCQAEEWHTQLQAYIDSH